MPSKLETNLSVKMASKNHLPPEKFEFHFFSGKIFKFLMKKIFREEWKNLFLNIE